MNVNGLVYILLYLAVAFSAVAEDYNGCCANCGYKINDVTVGVDDEGRTATIAICPGCKELRVVYLKKGDEEGKKKYKCAECDGKLYLYRDGDGLPLTEITEGEEYQCPRCGSYELLFEPVSAENVTEPAIPEENEPDVPER